MTNSFKNLCVVVGVVFAAANPANAQPAEQNAATPLIAIEQCPTSGKARISCLERQAKMAVNARQQLEVMRRDMALKDELLVLAVERNATLYEIASEIVDKGLSKGSLEPFLQLRRVEMENLKQSYEDRLREARFYSTTLPPSVEKRMEEELSQSKATQSENGDS